MTTLSERAILVALNISQWAARRYDKRASLEVASNNGVAADVARVNKNLLPMQGALDAVHKKTSEIRNIYLQHTMPWAQDGMRIIKSSAFIEFTQLMRPLQEEWERLVKVFIDTYPDARWQAERHLGGLFDPNDYPAAWDLEAKFKFQLSFVPVPDIRDWRVEVGDAERDRLFQSIEQQLKDAHKVALTEAWRRVYDVVSRAHERLADPKNVFRDSLIDNAVELCRLLPALNVTDDPDLEAMRREVEGSLCAYNVGTLRSDPAVREGVADKMSELMDKMSAFYSPAA